MLSDENPSPHSHRRKRPRLIAVLPTLLTLGNGACGFGAITFAAKLGPMDPSTHTLLISASLIFLAMLFDMLDGSAARLTRQTSELGAQLDSLCDGVSFGVAPAFLMLQYMTQQLSTAGGIPWYPRLLWTIAVLYALCALLRLARFNVETEDDDLHDEFSGLPSPAAAGTVAAFPFAMPAFEKRALAGSSDWAQYFGEAAPATVRSILPLVTLAAACLMVSRIRYPHFFNQLFRGRKTRGHVIQTFFAVGVVFLIHELALPLIFCGFAFVPPAMAAFRQIQARRYPRATEVEDVHRVG
jgi:CDP-diacylglycerol---serine O-phosphatidyltransferase